MMTSPQSSGCVSPAGHRWPIGATGHDDALIYTALFKRKLMKAMEKMAPSDEQSATRCITECLSAEDNESSKPRVSNITFSTVTSATGLPTIAAEPSRSRSSSYWKPEQSISPSTSTTDHQSRDARGNDVASSTERRSNGPTHENAPSFIECAALEEAAGVYREDKIAESTGTRKSSRKSVEPPLALDSAARGISRIRCDEAISPSTSDDEVQPRRVLTNDGCQFDCDELLTDPLLEDIQQWALPIFVIAEKHPQTILSRMTYKIFQCADLFRIFKLSHQKFFNYFHALERGYWDIPYHNRIHAADVLHGCYYLTCHPVEPFANSPTTQVTCGSIDQDALDDEAVTKPPFAPISRCMSNLELMALYTAAAMHDYDHPGKTNAFLVSTEDRKAILYNDRSVLENHHAAESWRLLSQPGNNFVDTLDQAENRRFRFLVLEYILATDLKQHFEIILAFNEKTNWDLHIEADKITISKMIIKLADINSPTKPYSLHRQWTERICAEFYEQGDEEKERNLPVTPYMDKSCPKVPQLQDSFITHLVLPLCTAMYDACLLPVLPGLEEPEILINLEHNKKKWKAEIAAEMTDSESVNTESSGVGGMTGDAIEEEEEQITTEECSGEDEVLPTTRQIEAASLTAAAAAVRNVHRVRAENENTRTPNCV